MVDGAQELGVFQQSEGKKPGIIENIKNLPHVRRALSWIDGKNQDKMRDVHPVSRQEVSPVVPYEKLQPNEQREIEKSMMIMLGNEDIYCVPSRSLPLHSESRNAGSVQEYKLRPCLVVIKSDGTTIPLTDKGIVGRNPANSVVLPDPSVSRSQVELTPGYDKFIIKNLTPSNETRVQDIPKIEPDSPTKLPSGKVVPVRLPKDRQVTMRVGDKELTLKYGHSGVPVVQIDGQDTFFPFDENIVGRISIGRNPESDIFIDDPLVSRKHLQLIRVGVPIGDGENFFLLDKSTNGTTIEVEKVKQTVAPEKKPSIIEDAVNRWAYSFDNHGAPRLQRKGELLRNNPLEITSYDSLRVIAPQGREQDVKNMHIPEIAQRVSDIIGGYPTDTPIDILVAPGKKYVARAVADAQGNYILLDMDNNTEGVVAHELVHAELGKKYGPSALPLASEGAALIIGQMACPDDLKANESHRHYGYNDVVSLLAEDKSIGLSPTALNEHAGGKLEEDIYEYSYFFGGHFGEFFISKYGFDNFLTFYKNTCGEIRDPHTGKLLAEHGRKLDTVQQRELTAAALLKTAKEAHIPGLTPEGFSREFNIYLKQQVSSDAGLLTQANVLLKKLFM